MSGLSFNNSDPLKFKCASLAQCGWGQDENDSDPFICFLFVYFSTSSPKNGGCLTLTLFADY